MINSIVVEWRIWSLGVLSWVLPFAASFLFFDRTGALTIPQPLFKSIMVVVFGGVGAGLLVRAFRRVHPSLGTGLVIGLLWLVTNLALDAAILLPMAKMGVRDYLYDIGLRYLLIPIMAMAMGRAAGDH